MDRIVLTGLEFFGRHGVYDEEEKLGARFVVDVEMFLNLSDIDDDLKNTVNYGLVYKLVTKEVTSSRYYLIEALANQIADRVLEDHTLIQRVIVRVHKPHAPIQGVFRDVFTEVDRSRQP
jgi:dihydroneopterin aldolase